jgi:succinate-semialdehyde dehydrogenase/glutarate-semialdehyde dehydrogenase
MIQSINPATLEVNAEIQSTAPGDVADIFANARQAQKKWAGFSIKKRLDHLMAGKEYLLKNTDDIARIITLDNGKTLLESLAAEIYPVLDMYRFIATDGRRALREEKLSNPIFPIARIESGNVFEPLGVIGIISPWNYPFAIPMTQILAALLAGNAVVLKPSNLTAYVGDAINKLFQESGMPQGVVNVLQGSGSVLGNAMMDARPDKVVFTGSVPVGRQLMARAAEQLIPITLELGGKDPFIVLPDADIERAASAAVWGAFVNAGQTCASVERVYVHQSVAQRFISKVVEKTQALRVGDGLQFTTDMGPLISEDRITLVEKHMADARAKGAEIPTGGERILTFGGYFYKPTVLLNVNHDMECMREETFGPTLPIMEYTDLDEAIRLANDSDYGLTASVWSKDTAKAKKIGRRINTGVVTINNCLITYGFAQAPWGGIKDSGIGRTHSVHGLYEYTSIKNITTHKSMLTHDLWWHPYSEPKFNGLKAALNALFCDGAACKAGGVVKLLKSFKLLS